MNYLSRKKVIHSIAGVNSFVDYPCIIINSMIDGEVSGVRNIGGRRLIAQVLDRKQGQVELVKGIQDTGEFGLVVDTNFVQHYISANEEHYHQARR